MQLLKFLITLIIFSYFIACKIVIYLFNYKIDIFIEILYIAIIKLFLLSINYIYISF